MAATDLIIPLVTLLLGVVLGLLWTLRRSTVAEHRAATSANDSAHIRAGLDRLDDRLRDLEHQRVAWQAQLHAQVDEVRHSTDRLSRETTSLVTALRRPNVRGRWGEMHLRRSVELAGMVAHCDFETQVTHEADDGRQRPDLVVRLPGGATVVVDAKVPLDAFLDASACDDPNEQQAHLTRHARQLRRHVDHLAGKAYWRAQRQSPELVVLFLPAEAFFSAALESEPGLLEHAAARRVVIATPTTLIALLRTVAYGWTSQALAERTREIQELGRELYERLGTAGQHLDRLGRSLRTSVEAFNAHVGSLEARVLVTARHFADIAGEEPTLATPAPLERVPRPLSAPEFNGVAPPVTGRRNLP